MVARVMRLVGKHWLVVASAVMLLYIGLPFLAPVLMHSGEHRWSQRLHHLFSPACHQLPERSFFLYGPQTTYTRGELESTLGQTVPRRYVGDEHIGYKMAICQRCTAIYAAWLALGGVFALFRSRIRPLGRRGFVLLLLPIAVDGVGQLIGLWASSWVSRVSTGILFSVAVVWLTYPYLEQGMNEMYRDALAMLNRVEKG
jgi:uncharacterized membrane protein